MAVQQNVKIKTGLLLHTCRLRNTKTHIGIEHNSLAKEMIKNPINRLIVIDFSVTVGSLKDLFHGAI
jgi:hypothetical protein